MTDSCFFVGYICNGRADRSAIAGSGQRVVRLGCAHFPPRNFHAGSVHLTAGNDSGESGHGSAEAAAAVFMMVTVAGMETYQTHGAGECEFVGTAGLQGGG